MDEKIRVYNTHIEIADYDLGDSEKLENLFRNYDPLTHKFTYFGMHYDSEKRILYIPSGLDLWRIKSYFNERYYTRVTHHPYKTIDNIMIKYKPRDEDQEEALRFMCGVNDYEDNNNLSQLSVALNTGVGKTYCAIATIAFMKIKSIVITGSNSLLAQWRSEIIKYTNLKDSDIVNINGSPICNMILSGNSKKADNGKIFLCSHGTLRSFGDTYGWDKVYKLFLKLGIGLKFFDEAHTNYSNMLMIDFFTNVYKTYYVTATPGRSNWKENNIYKISLKNVPMIDLFKEENNHTDYIAIKYNSRPTPQQISKCKNLYGLDRMKYIDYITKNPEFYKMMRIVMDLVIKCKGRVLMYIGTNEGILRVYHWIGTEYPEFIGDIGIFTSIVDKTSKLEEKKKKLLLSTTKSAGLGEHIEGLKMTIVVAEPFKSEILARQTLGRTRDSNTIYIELVDLGFRYLRKFYNDKLPVFNKYALSVSDSHIDSYELDRRASILEDERIKIQENPLTLNDPRFDFSKIVKKEEFEGPQCPVFFINKNK